MKHRFFKNTIKNMTKSLARKHQIAVAYHWESVPFRSVDCGPVKTVKLKDLANGEIFAEELQIDLNCKVDVTSLIAYFEAEYHPGLLVCSNIEDLPVFSKIMDIVTLNGDSFYRRGLRDTLFCRAFPFFSWERKMMKMFQW